MEKSLIQLEEYFKQLEEVLKIIQVEDED